MARGSLGVGLGETVQSGAFYPTCPCISGGLPGAGGLLDARIGVGGDRPHGDRDQLLLECRPQARGVRVGPRPHAHDQGD